MSQDKKLRILLATGIFPPDIGGPATYVKMLAEELPKFDCELRVVTYSSETQKAKSDKRQNVYLVNRDQNILLRYFKYFWQVYRLAKWADIIYAQDPFCAGLPTWLACKIKRKDYILKIVGDYAWEQGRQRYEVSELLDKFQDKKYSWQVEIMRIIQRIVAKGALKIVTPSQYLKSIIVKWGINSNKIEVIYNAAEKVEVRYSKEQTRAELDLRGDIILSVGRLVPWKGFGLLIDIIPELLIKNPNFRLIIIGEGPEREKLETQIRNLKLADRIILIEAVEQKKLWQYMRASDLFVLNTGYEGLPHILIEAMQIGLPVITTEIGGNFEVVEHNKTGLLVNYNHKEQFKKAILELWQNKEEKERIIKNANNILEKFSKQKMIERIFNSFKKVV